MCTVSFINLNPGYILTSNRDEDSRRASGSPSLKRHQGQELLFPGDPLANGSWIAMRKDGAAACLLNGAFEKHERKQSYRLSRGTLLIDVLSKSEPAEKLADTDLKGIEPFSLLIVSPEGIADLYRWDETELHREKGVDRILLSSATLYPANERVRRRQSFQDFLTVHPYPSPTELFEFHQSSYTEDERFDFIMSRPPYLRTLSTTQIACQTGKQYVMRHKDYLKQMDEAYAFDERALGFNDRH